METNEHPKLAEHKATLAALAALGKEATGGTWKGDRYDGTVKYRITTDIMVRENEPDEIAFDVLVGNNGNGGEHERKGFVYEGDAMFAIAAANARPALDAMIARVAELEGAAASYLKHLDAHREWRRKAAASNHNQVCSAANEMLEDAEKDLHKALEASDE